MWRNYLKTAVRNLWKNRVHALVNVGGLSLGIAGSLVLFLFIRYHTTFENHVPDRDLMHRLALELEFQGEVVTMGLAAAPSIDRIRQGIPQVEDATFLDYRGAAQIMIKRGEREDRLQLEEGFFVVDSSFFHLFPSQVLAGRVESLTGNPSGAVISERLAVDWFGDVDATGKFFTLDNEFELQVVAVIANPPAKTDLKADLLISMAKDEEFYQSLSWGYLSTNFQCFFKLQPGANASMVTDRLTEIVNEERGNPETEMLIKSQPFAEMHNDDDLAGITESTVSKDQLLGLTLIAVFLLITACINFVNLSTALAVHRAKEVGVRKALGSARSQLVTQFLGETTIIVLISVVLGLVLAELGLIQLSNTFNFQLDIKSTPPEVMVPFLLAVSVIIILLSGMYPSLVTAGFEPAKALKDAPSKQSSGGVRLRKGLVILQFSISQFLIIATTIVILQNRFAANQELGFEVKAKMIVPLEDTDLARARSFQDQLESLPEVSLVSLSNAPGSSGNITVNGFDFEGESYTMEYLSADENYLDVYGIELLAGEGLIHEDSATRCLVNESTMRRLGISEYNDMIGQTLVNSRGELLVTGVIKDYHNHSLHMEKEPLVLANFPEDKEIVSLSLNTTEYSKVSAEVERIWNEFYPEYLMNHQFQDDILAEFYESEQMQRQLLTVASFLAIFIGCLGLYGLSSFLITKKTKEIGVRKALGASINQILWIFSKEYLVLISLGFALAVGFAYWMMDRWLSEFVYRISLSWWISLVGLVMAVLVAAATVGYRSFQAARTNPIRALRYE